MKKCTTHTGAKSPIQPKIHIFDRIHIFKVSFSTKSTFLESDFSQNSHFQNLIFHRIHIFQTSNSREFWDKKFVFASVCNVAKRITL